jgi:hypothetical protein
VANVIRTTPAAGDRVLAFKTETTDTWFGFDLTTL